MAIHIPLHPLHRADGSAAYTSPNGYAILAAVNGPVEVQRRNELPDEAHIEVNVRPHDGVGQVKERHLELILANTLRDVVLVHAFPRQMVQLTLQILKIPVDDRAIGRLNPQAGSYLPVLPWLLNAACLALLDASIPMRCTFASTIIALMPHAAIREHPSVKDLKATQSLHVLTFSSMEELLLVESEGRFTVMEFGRIEDKAKNVCFGDPRATLGNDEGEQNLHDTMKHAVQEKMRRNERWKQR